MIDQTLARSSPPQGKRRESWRDRAKRLGVSVKTLDRWAQAGILPPPEYGYCDWYPLGTTVCSTVHNDSKPHSSATCAMPSAFSGSANGPALANMSPNFTGGSLS